MIAYSTYHPPEDLRDWIRVIWTLRCDNVPAEPAEFVIPDGFPELIFNLGEPFQRQRDSSGKMERQPLAMLNGQIRQAIVLSPPPLSRLVGLRLQPWALAQLTREPAHRFTDTWADLNDLSRKLLPRLHDALLHSADNMIVPTVIEHFRREVRLLQTPGNQIQYIVRTLMNNSYGESIAHISRDAGTNTRSLQRLLATEVGLTPKHLARVSRVQQVLRLRKAHPQMTWARVAARVGYFDQSHLNKDFLSIVGNAPSHLLLSDQSLAGAFLYETDADA